MNYKNIYSAISNQKRKACAYVRVSTEKPEQIASLDIQKRFWYEYLMHDDRLEFIDVFTDIAKSGKSTKGREQLNTLVEMALNGEIDIIFTKSISRFSRNLEDTLNIIYELREKGVEIYFDDEDLSTMNPHCSLTLNVLAKNAADHLNVISESMKWSARKRFERGEVELNSTILGYAYKDKKLHIVPEQAEIIKDIFNMYLSGLGVTKIAAECENKGYKTATGLDTWKKSTISKILKNEKYTGDSLLQKTYKNNFKKVANNGEIDMYYCENTHEPIIPKDDFNRVQEIMSDRAKNTCRAYNRYDFSGKIICECGAKYKRKIYGIASGYPKPVWCCTKYLERGKSACESHAIKESVLQELFVSVFNECVSAKFQSKGVEELYDKLKSLLGSEKEINSFYIKKVITKEQYILQRDELLFKIKETEDHISNLKKKSKKIEHKGILTEYDGSLALKYIDKVVISKWDAAFYLINGFTTSRRYSNGRAGNKPGWNKTGGTANSQKTET